MNANAIVRELISYGLTQKEIERRAGVHQSVVSALNTGRHGKRTPYATMVALQGLLHEVHAERSGAAAFRLGQPISSNPFQADTKYAKCWDEGFQRARDRADVELEESGK